jgi:hypothetical protein
MSDDYPCPDCGYEGPHALFPSSDPREPVTAECGDGDCGIEFEIAVPV